MEHGYAKLARGPDNFASILRALGMPAPTWLSWATVLVELLGGLAVIVGAFIPLASVPMTFVLLVAIFTVHLPNGFSSIKLQSVTAAGAHFGQPGYETDLLYLAGLAALVLGGSGPFALDQLVRRSSRTVPELNKRDDHYCSSCAVSANQARGDRDGPTRGSCRVELCLIERHFSRQRECSECR